MTILVLVGLLLITAIVFIRFATGCNLLVSFLHLFRRRKPDRAAQVQQFVESTVAKMLEDERVVDAVYHRAQMYDSNSAYIFTTIGLFFSIAALPLLEQSVWLTNLVWTLIFLLGMVSYATLGRVDERIDQYQAILLLYEEKIGIPKRP